MVSGLPLEGRKQHNRKRNATGAQLSKMAAPKRERITKADMRGLRRRLPRGFRNTAVDRLAKDGKVCTPQYVSQQFDEPRDLKVIAVLTSIAEEHESSIAAIAARIRRKPLQAA